MKKSKKNSGKNGRKVFRQFEQVKPQKKDKAVGNENLKKIKIRQYFV